MKTLLILSLLGAVSLSHVLAQQPASKSDEDRNFFQRFFGSDAKPQPAQGNASPKQPSEPEPTTWQLFPSGKLPAGKAVSEADAANLPDGSYADQTTYLIGDFIVTATGDRRAVLRTLRKDPSIRIVAEYLASNPVPAEGTKLTIDGSKGLQIRQVRRNAHGQLTIYVRDVTQH